MVRSNWIRFAIPGFHIDWEKLDSFKREVHRSRAEAVHCPLQSCERLVGVAAFVAESAMRHRYKPA